MMIHQHNVPARTVEELRKKWHVPTPRDLSAPTGMRRGYEVFTIDTSQRHTTQAWKARNIRGVRFTADEARALAEEVGRRQEGLYIKIAMCLMTQADGKWFRVFATPVPNVLETLHVEEPQHGVGHVMRMSRHPSCTGTCQYALDVDMPDHACQGACQYLQQGVPADDNHA